MYQQMIFVNLPVQDLEVSKKFFTELGYSFNTQFTTDECACLVISDTIFAMLMTEQRFADFATKPLPDRDATTGMLLCLSARSRDEVDAVADAALAAGGSAAGEAEDHGMMYGRSFLDPDGHHWEILWMDPAAVEG